MFKKICYLTLFLVGISGLADEPTQQHPNFNLNGIGIVTQILDKATGNMNPVGGGWHLSLFTTSKDSKEMADTMVDWILTPLTPGGESGLWNHVGEVESARLGLGYKWTDGAWSPVTSFQARFHSSSDLRTDLDNNIAYANVGQGFVYTKGDRMFLLLPFAGTGTETTTFAETPGSFLKFSYGATAKTVIGKKLFAVLELVHLGSEDYLADGKLGSGQATLLSASADAQITRRWYFTLRSDLSSESLENPDSHTVANEHVLSLITGFVRNFQ